MICRNCSKLIKQCESFKWDNLTQYCLHLGWVHLTTGSHFCDINHPVSMGGDNLATPDPEFHTEEAHDSARSG